MSTELYRFYNEADELLYVGITDNWPTRFHSHAKKAAWYKQARRIQMTPFENRDEALAEELRAIHEEHPIWNINGSATANATAHFRQVVAWAEAENWYEPFHQVIVQELGEGLSQLDIGVWNFPESWQTHPKIYAPIFSDYVIALAPIGLIPCEICIRAATHGTVRKWRNEVIDFIDDFCSKEVDA